jgi:hypothetical protein
MRNALLSATVRLALRQWDHHHGQTDCLGGLRNRRGCRQRFIYRGYRHGGKNAMFLTNGYFAVRRHQDVKNDAAKPKPSAAMKLAKYASLLNEPLRLGCSYPDCRTSCSATGEGTLGRQPGCRRESFTRVAGAGLSLSRWEFEILRSSAVGYRQKKRATLRQKSSALGWPRIQPFPFWQWKSRCQLSPSALANFLNC